MHNVNKYCGDINAMTARTVGVKRFINIVQRCIYLYKMVRNAGSMKLNILLAHIRTAIHSRSVHVVHVFITLKCTNSSNHCLYIGL